jgi:hypothetical protein
VRVADNVALGVAVTVRVKVVVAVAIGVTVCDPVGVAVETTGPVGAHVFVSLFLHPTITIAGSSINTMKRLASLFNLLPPKFCES